MTSPRWLPAALVLQSCLVDQEIVDKPVFTFDSGESPTLPGDSTEPTEILEECNGMDDDGDGLVDEGFPDADANGVADCLPGVCEAIQAAVGGAVALNPETVPWGGAAVKDPWNVEIAWDLTVLDETTGGYFEAASTPLVVPGDGVNEARIVTVGLSIGRPDYNVGRALFGSSDSVIEQWFDGPVPAQNGAVADVNEDGEPEFFFHLSDGTVASFAIDGTQLWEGEFATVSHQAVQATVADLRGDGDPSVFFEDRSYSANTGESRLELGDDSTCIYHPLAIGDLDRDGVQEIAFCEGVYSAAGIPLWEVDLDDPWESIPLLVQADGDPEGEVAFVHRRLSVFDTDGALLAESDEAGADTLGSGPPCAGDFDGDGEMEVAWPDSDTMYAFNLDGSLLWSTPIEDPSTLAGCTASDLDGDGHAEVLYMDEVSFSILDGATGASLFRDDTVRSHTAAQTPIIVDLDGDDHAEIVIAMGNFESTEPFPLLRAYRHAGEGWTPGGVVWPSSDYSMVNVNEDGTVPRNPEPSWSRYGVFRGRLASMDSHPLGVDLTVSLHEVCVEDCADGPVVLSLQVTNHGSLPVADGTSLAVYAVEGGTLRNVANARLPALAPATAADGFLLELAPADIGPGGLRVVVDDDGAGAGSVREVDEDNNVAEWAVSPCG